MNDEFSVLWVVQNIEGNLFQDNFYFARLVESRRSYFHELKEKEFYENYLLHIIDTGFFRIHHNISRRYFRFHELFHEFDPDKGFPVSLTHAYGPFLRNEFLHNLSNNEAHLANEFIRGCCHIAMEGFHEFKTRLRRRGSNVLEELPQIGPIRKRHLAREIGLETDLIADESMD